MFSTDPNTFKSIIAIFNGWDANAKNYPSFFNEKQPLLINVWTDTARIGDINAYHMQYMIGNDKIMQRYYDEFTHKWLEWI